MKHNQTWRSLAPTLPPVITTKGYWRPNEIDVWPYGHDGMEYYVMISPTPGGADRRIVCVGITDAAQLAALLTW